MSKEMSFFILIFLTGCSFVTRNEMDAAIILCSPNQGVDYFYTIIRTDVTCKNGANFDQLSINKMAKSLK